MATNGQPTRPSQRQSRSRRRLLRFELLGQRRVLASITGEVFHDLDDSFHKDAEEVGLANRVVYIDLDDDAEVDRGEPLAITDEAGRFEFTDLAPGDYVVRAFNGTNSQRQNTPFLAEQLASEVALDDPFAQGQSDTALLAGDEYLISYTASGAQLTQVDLEAETTHSLTLGGDIVDFQSLGQGELIVLVSEGASAGPSVVLVSFADNSITPLAAPGGVTGTPYGSDVAIAQDGHGLLIPTADPGVSVPLHAVHFDAATDTWTATATPLHVDSAASVWPTPDSPILLVAQPAGNGTQVAQWSTVTASLVPGSERLLEDVIEVLGYDDDSGLLIARDVDGGVLVFDAHNQYATLHDLPEMQGVVTLDGHRELLFGMLDDGLTLTIFDMREGQWRVNLPLTSAPGVVSGLALSDRGNRISLRRQESLSQVRIDLPDAHYVTLEDEAASKDVLFGMLISDSNDAPAFPTAPTLEVLEDNSLFLPAPGILAELPNPEGDTHIAVQLSPAQNGTATVHPDGTVSYVPDDDFFGSDSFEILVTDGRDDTDVVTITVDVLPVDDLLQGFDIDLPSFPEDVLELTPIGTIDLHEVDGDTYIITIDDPRFFVEDGQVLISEGADFDYEIEPTIFISIDISDPENELDTTVTTASLTIEDADDPPTGISPETAEADENTPGLPITEITIIDPDSSAGYTLETTDERFLISGHTLLLREDVQLDFEATPVIQVPVIVRNDAGQVVLERQIEVTVNDTNDAPTSITLSSLTVREMVSGYHVGIVTAIDQDTADTHTFSVDDSRFEIVNARLKLRDGIFVRREEQAEIQITITATDGVAPPISQEFLLVVQENTSPWTNPDNPTDVNNSGDTTPLDALIIINTLNNEGPHDLNDPFPSDSDGPRYYDVNGDGQITPIDALIIINQLNRQDPSAEPEGEADTQSPAPPTLEPSVTATPVNSLPPEPIAYGYPADGFGNSGFDDTDDDEDR